MIDVQHDIKTDHPPIKQRHRALTSALQYHVDNALEKMSAELTVKPFNLGKCMSIVNIISIVSELPVF